MDMGRIVTWAIVAAIGYGGYTYLSTGDVSIMPPTQQTVLDLVTKAKPKQDAKWHYSAGKTCERVSGGVIKGGIYSCEYKVFRDRSSYGQPLAIDTVLIEKKNGQWQIKK